MTTFDDVLLSIGEFGPYQKRIYCLLCLTSIPLIAVMSSNIFILGVPEHRCKIPGLDNDTFEVQGPFHEELINATIPRDGSGQRLYDRCNTYVTGDWVESDNMTYRQQQKCNEWIYDSSVFKYTFAQQLNMVCDDAIMIPNAQMVFFFGVLVGSAVYGQLSDILGRIKTLYLCLLLFIGSSAGLVGMVEYVGFCVLMFILGGAVIGFFVTSYVLSMEFVGPSKRFWIGNFGHVSGATGGLYLVLMVYLLRDWKYFTLAITLPSCLFLPIYWIIPESSRWLISKHRKEEAEVILQKIATANGTVFNSMQLNEIPPSPKQGRVWQLFSTKVLAFRTLIIYLNWFVCSMSFYGVILNIGSLGGDFYFNFTLMMLVDFPVFLVGVALMDRIGRKRLHVGFLCVGGAACMATIWPVLDGSDSLHPILIAFSLVGKFCVSGAFGTIYILSTELFPTVVRNAGLGTSSSIARVGSMLAPYIAKSADLIGGNNGQAIPQAIFGAAMFVAGLLALLLPETMNRQLPETIENADQFDRKTPSKVIQIDKVIVPPGEITVSSIAGSQHTDRL